MAIPTINAANLTLIDSADSTTNWSGWGQNSAKWGTSTDIVREGNASNALAPFQTGDGGWGRTGITSFDATANLVMVWVFVTSSAFVNSMTNYGVYVRLATGTDWTSAYRDYRVGGNDVAWVGSGWRLIVVDANRTADRSNGSPTMTAITRVGVGFNITATASKSDVICIDKMFYGTYMEITTPSHIDATNGITFTPNGGTNSTVVRLDGGSWITDGYEDGDYIRIENAGTSIDGTYVVAVTSASTLTIPTGFTGTSTADTDAKVYLYTTLEDIYQKDGPTDDNWWGVVDKNRDGAYEINYPLVFGDVSGSLDCCWISKAEIITYADQRLSSGATRTRSISTVTDTGDTYVLIGESSGTGEDRVGFGGSVFNEDSRSLNTSTQQYEELDLSDATMVEMYGTTLDSIGGSGAQTGPSFPNATGNYVFNCTFIGSGEVQCGQAQIRNCTFTGYIAASYAAILWNDSIDIKRCNFISNYQAIRFTSSAGSPYTFDNLSFAANTYDVYNNSGSSITINLSESDATTYTGNTVTFVSSIQVTLTGLQINSEVRVYKTSDDSVVDGVEDSGTSFAWSAPQGTSVYIVIHHVDYEYIRITGYTVPSSPTSIPIQQREDRWYSNP